MTGPDATSGEPGGRIRRRLLHWARSRPDAATHGTTTAVAGAFYAVSAPLEVALYEVPVPAGLLLPGVQCAALVIALRFRLAAVAAFTAATAALSWWTDPSSAPWPWTLTGIMCFGLLVGSVWAVWGWRSGVVAYVVPLLVSAVPMLIRPDTVRLANTVVVLGFGAAAALVGALLREWSRIAAQLVHEREHAAAEVERRMIVEERQRIARELHDVVAHGLSLIQVQARFARYRFPDMPDDVRAEVEDIARTAQGALGEMRQMLGALRGDEPAERAPQPTLADLPALVEETARAGARISLRLDAPPFTPTAVGIAAYRIAQEGISNAVRHAPGAPIEVSASAHDGSLLVAIQNEPVDGGGPAAGVHPNGHGLIGMRERATMLCGTLSTGRTAVGGFRVAAVLPLGERPPAVGPAAADADGPRRGGADG